MTNYMNYIKNIINTETEMDKDSIEKLVKIAYYMGRAEAKSKRVQIPQHGGGDRRR